MGPEWVDQELVDQEPQTRTKPGTSGLAKGAGGRHSNPRRRRAPSGPPRAVGTVRRRHRRRTGRPQAVGVSRFVAQCGPGGRWRFHAADSQVRGRPVRWRETWPYRRRQDALRPSVAHGPSQPRGPGSHLRHPAWACLLGTRRDGFSV